MLVEYEIFIRIVAAVFMGGIIGLERELDREVAGIRTHMLVAVGAAAYTIASLSIAPDDPARVAAGIVTGIGFIGAGAIFKYGDSIKGLTTAADLWCSAAIGLACGIGYYFLGATVTAIVLLVLILKKEILKIVEKRDIAKKA